VALLAVAACGAVLVSGGASEDPRTPPALPGLPPPFLGTAVVGAGGLTAAVDAYGAVVDLRPAGPASDSLIENPVGRQNAGTVDRDTGIVPRVEIGGRASPLWRARRLRQRYLPGSNVLVTSASVAGARVRITDAAVHGEPTLARRFIVSAAPGTEVGLRVGVHLRSRANRCDGSPRPQRIEDEGSSRVLVWRATGTLRVLLRCRFGSAGAITNPIAASVAADRRWLAAARPLSAGAPPWAQRLYRRSLLALRALTDMQSGAAAAGAREGWAYVWPRDAAAVAIALAQTGYRREARRVVGFLRRLDLEAGARFRGDTSPVTDGRPLQGDARGWIEAAADAAAVAQRGPAGVERWRERGDYQERSGDRGDYLANAIAAGEPASRLRSLFASAGGLHRQAGDPGSGLDSAAAWAVRPFPRPRLRGAVVSTLEQLRADGGRFGIQPAENWPGDEPWSAPTAWSAWSMAVLGEREASRLLLAGLRRAATPAGDLPERVDAATGIPRSTTPLAWSHAFAALALRVLWPHD
jgi:hypothetical protein